MCVTLNDNMVSTPMRMMFTTSHTLLDMGMHATKTSVSISANYVILKEHIVAWRQS